MQEIRKLLPKLPIKDLISLLGEIKILISTHEINHLINKCIYENKLLNETELNEESIKQLDYFRNIIKNELVPTHVRTRANELALKYLTTGKLDIEEM